MASELESDLQDTVDWGRKWRVGFNAGKTKLVSFGRSHNTSAIDLKMDGSAHEEKSSFNKPKLSFSCTLDWTLTLSPSKLPPRIMVYFSRCLSEWAQRVTLPYSRGRSTRHSDRFHDFTVTISRSYKDAYVNSLSSHS